jgi:hypothetical protein
MDASIVVCGLEKLEENSVVSADWEVQNGFKDKTTEVVDLKADNKWFTLTTDDNSKGCKIDRFELVNPDDVNGLVTMSGT